MKIKTDEEEKLNKYIEKLTKKVIEDIKGHNIALKHYSKFKDENNQKIVDMITKTKEKSKEDLEIIQLLERCVDCYYDI